MKLLCLGIGFGYVFYMCNGFLTLTPRKKPYNALFETRAYLLHLAIAVLLAVLGFWYFPNSGFQLASCFVPVVFLISFLIGDTLVKLSANRHLIIADRWDRKPPNYKWYVDGLISVLLIVVSLSLPFVLAQYLRSVL